MFVESGRQPSGFRFRVLLSRQPSSFRFRVLLRYKTEITILYSAGCRITYFETKGSGGNDDQNKLHN